jgi:hypothetical protein
VELLILGIFSDVEPIFHVFVSVTPLKQTLYYPSRRHREKKKHFKHRLVYLSRFSSCCQSPFYSRRYFNFRFVDVDENPGKIGSFRGTHCACQNFPKGLPTNWRRSVHEGLIEID